MKVWALIAAAVLILIAYVPIQWVTGPCFERVEDDASDPSMRMKVS